jgi:hypothetical protein
LGLQEQACGEQGFDFYHGDGDLSKQLISAGEIIRKNNQRTILPRVGVR